MSQANHLRLAQVAMYQVRKRGMSAAAINPTNFRQDINISKLCNRIQIQDRRMEFFDVKGKIFIL